MKKLVFTLLMTLLYCTSEACSCQSSGQTICESFKNDSFVTLVCVCRKIEAYAYGFKVERITNLYGTETRDTFWVWGDNGALCRMSDIWDIGDTMILSLQKCDTMGNWIENPDYPLDVESIDDYQVSGCGSYFANVQNGNVVGYINNPIVEYIPLIDFIKTNCFSETTTIDETLSNSTVSIFPQPASGIVNVFIDAPISTATYYMYNINGQMLQEGTFLTGKNTIDIDKLASGMYSMVIHTKKGRLNKKFLIGQ